MGSPRQLDQSLDSIDPLTVVTEKRTDAEIGRVIEDARKANKELHISDTEVKVIQ